MKCRWILSLLVLAIPSLAFGELTVSPMLIEKTLTPDDRELVFTVANDSEHEVEVELSTTPLQHTRSGEAIVGKADYRWDISRQIRLPSKRVKIGPRRWRRIRVQVDLPERTGGGYAFIHVATVPSAERGGPLLTSVNFCVIVEVIFRERGADRVQIEEVTSGKAGVRVAVRNEGHAHARPTGTFELRDPAGKAVFTSALESKNIFPGLTRELSLSESPAKLPPGSYSAVVTVTTPAPARYEIPAASVDGTLLLQKPRVAETKGSK